MTRLTSVQYLVALALLVVVLNTRPCVSQQQQLRCVPRQYLGYDAVKSGCRPQRLIIYGCYGHCHTAEVPVLLSPYKKPSHSMCSYGQVEPKTITLDDCDPGVDPTFRYVDALSCACKKCTSHNTYCQGM